MRCQISFRCPILVNVFKPLPPQQQSTSPVTVTLNHLTDWTWDDSFCKVRFSLFVMMNEISVQALLLWFYQRYPVSFLCLRMEKNTYMDFFYTRMYCVTSDILFTLSQPLGHEVWGGDREEGGVVGFSSHSLGQVGLPRSWRAEQQDASPRSPLTWGHREQELF